MPRSPFAALALSAALLAAPAAQAQQDEAFTLTILHTNDFHARFEPISRFGSTCAPEDNAAGECFGGAARLATAIAAARDRAETAILVDGGDPFQGSLFYTYYKGAAAAEMMDRLGYEGMAVGNHEFDDGPQVLRDFIDAVPFPVLMANADYAGEPALADLDLAHAVIEAGGQRIGLIGLTPVENPDLSSPGPGIAFTDPVAATQASVDALTADGVDKIVVLSHSGLGVDRRVAENTTGVDVIVGGHSHTLLSNTDPDAAGPYPLMVGETAIVQAEAYGKYLGEVSVTFDAEGRVVAATGDPILLDASVAEDAAMAAWVAEMAVPLDEIRQRVVAEAAAPIDGDRASCRAGECSMGNLVADAMLDRVRDQGIDIAITNGGGLRASIDAGEVTMGEVLTVLPFQNTLSTFRVTGATIRAALENGVSAIEDGAGRFPQVAGLTFRFDPGAAPGSRIVDVKVDSGDGFVPLEAGRVYGVVSNNFVRTGGDGYAMFEDAQDAYDFGPDLADVTAEYLGRNAPYRPYLDGRIDVLE